MPAAHPPPNQHVYAGRVPDPGRPTGALKTLRASVSCDKLCRRREGVRGFTSRHSRLRQGMLGPGWLPLSFCPSLKGHPPSSGYTLPLSGSHGRIPVILPHAMTGSQPSPGNSLGGQSAGLAQAVAVQVGERPLDLRCRTALPAAVADPVRRFLRMAAGRTRAANTAEMQGRGWTSVG